MNSCTFKDCTLYQVPKPTGYVALACVYEMYDKFVKAVHDEMSSNLTRLSGGGRRKNTPYKPYWCDELLSILGLTGPEWQMSNLRQLFKCSNRLEIILIGC